MLLLLLERGQLLPIEGVTCFLMFPVRLRRDRFEPGRIAGPPPGAKIGSIALPPTA